MWYSSWENGIKIVSFKGQIQNQHILGQHFTGSFVEAYFRRFFEAILQDKTKAKATGLVEQLLAIENAMKSKCKLGTCKHKTKLIPAFCAL